MKNVIVGSVAVVAFLLVACSARPNPTGGATGSSKSPESSNNSGSTTGGTKNGASSSSSSSSSGSPSNPSTPGNTTPATTTTAPAGACSPAQGVDACNSCCEAKFPQGQAAQDKLDETYDTCICAAGVCATQCAQSACSDTGPDPVEGDACSTCMDGATACNQADATACAADANCKALSDCMDTCDP